MQEASQYAYLKRRKAQKKSASIQRKPEKKQHLQKPILMKQILRAQEQEVQDLNVFLLTFKGMNEPQKKLAGGDPYSCKKCKAILNKFSKLLNAKQYAQKASQLKMAIQLKPSQSLWECQFCCYPNVLQIEREQIPTTDDIFYLLQSEHENLATENDSTLIFCIDTSGSMNSTTEIAGKVDLKFGLSEEEINMLKQFMEPGDEAQFNFLPGAHNKDKSFISRKQCILSAIQSFLQDLRKKDPFKRVGFVSFNNEIIVAGDNKVQTINIVGDKLNKRQEIVNTLKNFKLTQPLSQCHQSLSKILNKIEAKGQTALGPALLSAIEVASKGSPGSTVTICTDGLANIGLGALQPINKIPQESLKFYDELSVIAKQKNITVNIITIKGQGAKMQVIGRIAQATNGNIKVVDPAKLTQDFANVMKDQVVGINVQTRIMLHKAMTFRNQDPQYLKENRTILEKNLPNASLKTSISFQYQLRCDEDLQFMEIDPDKLKTVPFQAQIIFTSPKGAKFLRVVTSECKTTQQKQQIKKQQKINLKVAHQRVSTLTANMYGKGDYYRSQQVNNNWVNYLGNNFQSEQHQQKQQKFFAKNEKLNKAIKNKHRKSKLARKQKGIEEALSEEEQDMKKSLKAADSDEDEMQFKGNLMERGWQQQEQE